MRISLFLMIFIITLFFIFPISAEGEQISGNTVYINNNNVYLSAYPHTLSESGYVYFNLTSKQYSGDIDFYFGFDEYHCKPISAEVLIADNWIDISDRFRFINYYFDGMYNWYYLNEIPIYSDTNYTLRAYLQTNEISTGGKYGVAVKPSSETISQAIDNGHFYYLDPWYDGNYLYRKRITLTGGASGAQTDYQLLLNVTYDSDMQADFDDLRFTNETHQMDAWLENKTDNEYALIWVETDTPADTVEADIYMYYGNVGAVSDWDGDATFPNFFEDFESIVDWDFESQYNTASYSFTVTDGSGDMMVNAGNDNHVIRYKKDCSFDTTGMHMLLCFKGDTNTQIYIDDTAEDRWRAAWLASPASYTVYDEGWELDGTVTNIRIHTKGIASGTQHNYFDYIVFHKYVVNPPTYIFGDEEEQSYIPPNSTNLQNTTGNFWINHTWQPESGNVTDSYNVSVNDVWYNETINTYWNITYEYGNDSWQNITIWAYNKSGIGTPSIGNISQNTQLLFTNFPTNLQYTHNDFWVNWTWDKDVGGTHIIDNYNVSINNTWYNSTTNKYYNHTDLDYELTSSIIFYGYNNTTGLSVYYISDSYTFPIKNKMVKCLQQIPEALTLVKDKFINIIPFLIAIILFAGFGLAIITITNKIKRW